MKAVKEIVDIARDIPAGSILGLNYSGMHDSAVALVSPRGEVLFACALERLSRIKQDGRPPEELLRHIPWERVSKIAVSTDEQYVAPEQPLSLVHTVMLPAIRKTGLVHGKEFREFLDALPAPKEYVCHQISHAASAFWTSGFDQALCLTYDGGMFNCPWFGGLYLADREKGIQPLDRFAASHHAKITTLYTSVTALLGFTPNKHEGKITGLAAYGTPSSRCRDVLWRLFTQEYFALEEIAEWFFIYSRETPPMLVVDTEKRKSLMGRLEGISREEIAATVQAMAEEHVLEILRNAAARGWMSKNICLSGGLFANVKINQRIRESGFDNIFISPPMTDDGTSLGAALHVASKGAHFDPKPLRHVFLGMEFSVGETEAVLQRWGLEYEKIEAPAGRLADELAKGAVVAVVQGAMEFGPRALGNRSILSQACNPGINDDLNTRLLRTEFMPFAPITRVEDAADCYVGLHGAERAAEFMTITFNCTERMREMCPAVVHVDQTARPQLVSRERHPFLHEILTAYHQRTGIPALINTSFNVHEEPIVCSPDDAIKGFLESSLDLLYLEGGFLVRFSNNRQNALASLQNARASSTRRSDSLRQVLPELFTRLNLLRRQAMEKEEEIKTLREAADERLKALERVGGEAARLQKECESIEDLKRALREKESTIQRLDAICEERLNLINHLHNANAMVRVVSRAIRTVWRLPGKLVTLAFNSLCKKLKLPVPDMNIKKVFRRNYRRCLMIAPQYLPVPVRAEKYPTWDIADRDLPRISIVTPSYMQGRYLKKTIQSVLDQDYPCLEYIVQDGKSTDDTCQILKSFGDRLASWESVKDDGQSDAIQRGFARSHGEILAYLNSDDLLLPGALRYVGAFFRAHPDVDVLYGHRILIDGDGWEIGRWVMPRHSAEDLRWADYIPQETMFWRRRIWEVVGGIDRSFDFAMDWDLVLRFQKAGARICRVPYFLACFRTHASQKSNVSLRGVGVDEMARIRRREHGREIHQSECDRASDHIKLRSYFASRLLEMGIRW